MKTSNTFITITMAIAISSLFANAGSFTNQVYGQSDGNNEITSEEDDSINYPKFLNCLSEHEEIRGYATDTEIKDCHEYFYNSDSESESSSNNDLNRSDEIGNNIDLWPIP
ncbi:MAG: hypothetical protein L0H53_06845 [Candidatus Nitrosocosmicus sp.]|nr:hypothetical protein [Candidatus Nitrosocosmicus sp.]MDN5868717.1 hypothetical protein [Candidatus Nitrosocosmicus sp.]